MNLLHDESEIFDELGRPYVHPILSTQLLHDLYGICCTYRTNYQLLNGLKVVNIPENVECSAFGVGEIVQYEIILDVFFTLMNEEIEYVAQALKSIC